MDTDTTLHPIALKLANQLFDQPSNMPVLSEESLAEHVKCLAELESSESKRVANDIAVVARRIHENLPLQGAAAVEQLLVLCFMLLPSAQAATDLIANTGLQQVANQLLDQKRLLFEDNKGQGPAKLGGLFSVMTSNRKS